MRGNQTKRMKRVGGAAKLRLSSVRRIAALVGAVAVAAALIASPASAEQTHLWFSRYNYGHDVAFSVAVSPDGTRVFVTGSSNDDYATVAYDASNGAQLWAARYNGPANGQDDAAALAVSPDGTKVFVTGTSARVDGSTTVNDYATVAYAASSGAQLWSVRHKPPPGGNAGASSIVASPDGTQVFVTGFMDRGSFGGIDYTTVAYDASTGAMVWGSRYNGPGKGDDRADALAVNATGTKVFVTGSSYGGPATRDDYATVAYDAVTGKQLWVTRFNGPAAADDRARAISFSALGHKLVVTGESGNSRTNGTSSYATIAYSAATGAQLWTSRYGNPLEGNAASAVELGPDGNNVFVTGSSTLEGETAFGTVAYNVATGSLLWDRRWVEGASNDALALAVSADGSHVFVAGRVRGAFHGMHGATVAYRASTGAELWSDDYGSSGIFDGSMVTSVAVGPDVTKVFVTGGWYEGDATGEMDYGTVAYPSG
jgi:WD40 repeat protein